MVYLITKHYNFDLQNKIYYDELPKLPVVYHLSYGYMKYNKKAIKYIVENKMPNYFTSKKITKRVHKYGCLLDEWSSVYIIKNNNLKCLKYAHKKLSSFYPFNMNVNIFWHGCITKNNLRCLKYAHENGCLFNSSTGRIAASVDNLELLKYLYKNNYQCEYNAAYFASGKNHLGCLKYLCENNCDISYGDEDSCMIIAVVSNNLEILKYLHNVYIQRKKKI